MKIFFASMVFATTLVHSTLSQDWQPTTVQPNSLWTGVACSSNAQKIVACVFSGRIWTSADAGATWTARDSNRLWQAVASSADGVILAGVVSGGSSRIYVSTNSGVDWAPRGPTNLNWTGIAMSTNGARMVASASNNQLYTSDDSGVTWIAREFNRNWSSVASSHDGSRLVAIAGAGQIYTSVNYGTNWTARENNRAWWGVASSANGSNLLASVFLVLDTLPGRLCVSTNAGLTWTSYETNGNWGAVAMSADGGKLFAVSRPNGLFISTNSGVTWNSLGITDRWSSIACSWNGINRVASSDATVGTGGTGRIYVSPPLLPPLTILPAPGNALLISWPLTYSNWNVQQSTELESANWDPPDEMINDDGTNQFIFVEPAGENRFFRLFKP